jgi:hypothetical protein
VDRLKSDLELATGAKAGCELRLTNAAFVLRDLMLVAEQLEGSS